MAEIKESISILSNATSSHTGLGAAVIFCSVCIGSLIGIQLDLYLEIACVVRGSCYGNEGLIFTLSLIHPLVMKLFFSALILALLSLPLVFAIPFEKLRSIGILSYSALYQIKVLGSALILTSFILLFLSLPIMVFFINV